MKATVEKNNDAHNSRVTQHSATPFFPTVQTQLETPPAIASPLPVPNPALVSEKKPMSSIQPKADTIARRENTEGVGFFFKKEALTHTPPIQKKNEEEKEQKPDIQKKEVELKPQDVSEKVQAKLTVGSPDDHYEHEANRTADRVMRMRDTDIPATQTPVSGVKTVGETQRNINTVQAIQPTLNTPKTPVNTPITPEIGVNITPLQRKMGDMPDIQERAEEKVETIMPAVEHNKTVALPPDDSASKPTIQKQNDDGNNNSNTVTNTFENTLNSRRGSGMPLPNTVRQFMEPRFGADFSRVRIHTDYTAVQMSRQINAQAFTYGGDIYFNQNKYSPNTEGGQHLLAHELTHTVQQGAASVQRQIDITATNIWTIQRTAWDTAISFLGNIADRVPGYRLLCVLFRRDLIRNEEVPFNGTNLVDGLMSLVPFGHDIFLQLRDRRILTKAFDFVSGRLTANNLTRERISNTLRTIRDSISVTDALSPIEFFKSHVQPIVRDAIRFSGEMVDALVNFIKEAAKDFLQGLLGDNKAYLLLTKILKRDPLTDRTVQATTAEIIEDFLKLIGKNDELEEMKKRGTIQKTADWIDRQISRFSTLLGTIQGLISRALAALSPENITRLVDNFTKLKDDVITTIKDVADFAIEVATTVLQYIKDALMGYLRENASSIPGYRLLTVILGKDPFTQETVPRNVVNLMRGFMSLIPGGEEKFNQMQETGAIARMTAWIDAKIDEFGMTWAFVQNLFIGLWNSFTIRDILQPLAAFRRIIETFGRPLSRLIGFLIEVIKKVVMVILEVMNFPTDIIQQIVARAMAAYEDIKRDPIQFFVNLLRAVKQGFTQFFGSIGSHLLRGLADWLFRELESANIRPPRDLNFRSILAFVLEVMGITVDRVLQKLEARLNRPGLAQRLRRMAGQLTGALAFVGDVLREGPGALWRHIQTQLSNLWTMVLDRIKSWLMTNIIDRMVQRLLSMLDPTGIMAVVNSFLAFYRAVQSFIERLREILTIINSFVGGIGEIAKGSIGSAANFLERTMASAVPTMIGFLANQIGLRNLGRQIGRMVEALRLRVDTAIDWVVNGAVRLGGALLTMGRDAVRAVAGWLGLRQSFILANREQHELFFDNNEELMMASVNPRRYSLILQNLNSNADPNLVQRADSVRGQLDTIKRNRNLTDIQKRFQMTPLFQELSSITTLILNNTNHGNVTPPNKISPTFSNGAKARSFGIQYLTATNATGGSAANTHGGALLGWQLLQNNGFTASAAWVKMHLLSEQLGGQAVDSNLTPARGPQTNIPFAQRIEHPARRILDLGFVIWYRVMISYHTGQYQDYPNSIRMSWGPHQYNSTTNQWETKESGTMINNQRVGGEYQQSPDPPQIGVIPNINTMGETALNTLVNDRVLSRLIGATRRDGGDFLNANEMFGRIRTAIYGSIAQDSINSVNRRNDKIQKLQQFKDRAGVSYKFD